MTAGRENTGDQTKRQPFAQVERLLAAAARLRFHFLQPAGESTHKRSQHADGYAAQHPSRAGLVNDLGHDTFEDRSGQGPQDAGDTDRDGVSQRIADVADRHPECGAPDAVDHAQDEGDRHYLRRGLPQDKH